MGRIGGISAERFCLEQSVDPVGYYKKCKKTDPQFLRKILLEYFSRSNPSSYRNNVLAQILTSGLSVGDRKIISSFIDEILIIDNLAHSIYYAPRIEFVNTWFKCMCDDSFLISTEKLMQLIPQATVEDLRNYHHYNYKDIAVKTFLNGVVIRHIMQNTDINILVERNVFCIPITTMCKKTAIELIKLLSEESCDKFIVKICEYGEDRRLLYMFRELHPEFITRCLLKNMFSDIGVLFKQCYGDCMDDIFSRDIISSDLVSSEVIDEINDSVASYLMLNE